MVDAPGDSLAQLRAWASSAFPAQDWRRAEHHHGAFHDVLVLPGEVALRAPLGGGGLARATREVGVLRAVEQVSLGVAVPPALSDVVQHGEQCGYLVGALPGAAEPAPAWPLLRDAFAALLDQLAATSTHLDLPPPRTWCGGSCFPAVVAPDLLSLLGGCAALAERAVSALLELPPPRRPGLVHGDFGGHNLLWADGRPSALIDWDHACTGDPATDVAPLVGAHGVAAVSEVVEDDEVLQRAMVHRATLPLQVAAAAHLAGRWALRDHALGSFARRCEEGTLHDPTGAVPDRW
ncbi:phosphotransferase family protein [Streptomyces sp. NP160]|uniref:phosphotransferase family protein n=1 Tax=Streptomyces sp. NP160 TaxID=2586637 RepID=UPI0015D64E57|nr:aminoglycoside phosphotransferase family protein [Streptomyces sp. NP160]